MKLVSLWLVLLLPASDPFAPRDAGGSGAPSRPDEDDAVGDLKVRLRSRDKWIRQDAVEDLALLDDEKAWELVLEALSDERGEVSDTAQLCLAAWDPPASLKALDGRDGLEAKDPWIRRRAAEAVGRMRGDIDGHVLAGPLRDDDPDVRRMAAWSIERLAAAGNLKGDLERRVLPALSKAARRDRDPLARARALFAWQAAARPETQGEVLDAVRAAARDKHAELRCAAAALTARLADHQEAFALLRSLAADRSLSVRTRAAQALADLGTREAARGLVGRLEKEPEERLGLRIMELLQSLSGLKHRRDPRPWKDWADRLAPEWRGERSLSVAGQEADANRTIAFAGLPVLSGRVAFLIDLSGSIWKLRADGRTKKEIVDERLREVLEGLPSDTLFNVIPYTGEPHPWEEELVPATKKNVRAATRFFERCRKDGTGNFWDAAMLALEDPATDTLIVLTDGVPTGGRRYRLELIVSHFLERNETRMVAVDSILVDAPRRAQDHWAQLSAGTGGRTIAIEL